MFSQSSSVINHGRINLMNSSVADRNSEEH